MFFQVFILFLPLWLWSLVLLLYTIISSGLFSTLCFGILQGTNCIPTLTEIISSAVLPTVGLPLYSLYFCICSLWVLSALLESSDPLAIQWPSPSVNMVYFSFYSTILQVSFQVASTNIIGFFIFMVLWHISYIEGWNCLATKMGKGGASDISSPIPTDNALDQSS